MAGLTQPISIKELEADVQVAEDMLRAGEHRAALQAYMALLEGLAAGHVNAGSVFRAADLVILERVSELAALFGHVAAADDLLHAMVQLCRHNGNHLGADHAQLKRAELLAGTGDLRTASDLLAGLAPRIGALDAIEIDADGLIAWEGCIAWRHFPAGELAVLLTRCYAVMGRILLGLGRYADALTMLERGLHHAEGANAPDLARRAHWNLLLLRARALTERGDLDVARSAVNDLARAPARTHAPVARVQLLELGGKLDLLQGRLDDATRRLRDAMSAYAEGGFARARAVSALNLANALVLLNRVGEALELAADAARVALDLGDDGLHLRCAAVQQLAIARRSSTAEAVTAALSVREMVEGPASLQGDEINRPVSLAATVQAGGYLASFEDRALAFQWELGTSHDGAARTLERIRETFGHTDSRIVQARLPALEGLLHAARGDDEGAAAAFDTALNALAEVGLAPERWQAMHLRARCLLRLRRFDEATELSRRADALLESLASSLDAGERSIYLLNKATVEEEHLATQLEGLVRETRRARGGSVLVRLRARLRTWRRLQALLGHLDWYKASLADRQLASSHANDIAHGAPLLSRMFLSARDQATLTFVVLPDRLLVIWSTFMGMGYAVSPVTRIELRERVRRWHEYAQGAFEELDGTQQQVAAHAEAGDEMLSRMARLLRLDIVLAALPARVDRLVILADDVLHGCPFAALRTAGRYLIERYAISMAFQSRGHGASDRRVASGLVVGVSSAAGATQLPAVEEECRHAADWFARHGVASLSLLEADATCDAVVARLTEVDMAHLACHGSFEPDQPDRSGLLLAEQPGRDGRLSIRRLASLRLHRCRHVTLTSCWSADSFVLPGRWIVSLPEVLWRSGAQSVLGSLWPVVDEVAAPLMRRLHAALERLPIDRALREAQLGCLTEAGSPLALSDVPVRLPYFWAGFQLYGDPSRLVLRR